MGADTPSELLEKEAKEDNTFWVLPWQLGQAALSPFWLERRNTSNFSWQPEQTYSYMGISHPPPTI
jgi:hypothetical protein